MCLRAQCIDDDDGGGVERVRWAQGIGDDERGIIRERGLEDEENDVSGRS